MSRLHHGLRALGRFAVATTTATVILGATPLLASASTTSGSWPSGRAAVSAGAEDILGDDGVTVKTANKQGWILSVDYTSDSPANSLTVGIERIVTTGGSGAEEHIWGFAYATKSALSFNPATGTGTLDTGNAYDPVVSVNLAFKAKSHAAAPCSSGSEIVYTGTLTGSAVLDTGLPLGGTVGGKSLTFNVKGSAPSITVDSGCVLSVDTCLGLKEFASGTTGTVGIGLAGSEAGIKIDEVTVVRSTVLSVPSGARREDVALLQGGRLSWNSKTKVFSVSTSTGGIVTGKATLRGGSPKTVSVQCVFSGKKYTLKETSDSKATYASPSGDTLTGHTTLTGRLAVAAKTSTGGYDVVTVS